MYNFKLKLVSFHNLWIPVNFYIKSALSSESGAQARGFLQRLGMTLDLLWGFLLTKDVFCIMTCRYQFHCELDVTSEWVSLLSPPFGLSFVFTHWLLKPANATWATGLTSQWYTVRRAKLLHERLTVIKQWLGYKVGVGPLAPSWTHIWTQSVIRRSRNYENCSVRLHTHTLFLSIQQKWNMICKVICT